MSRSFAEADSLGKSQGINGMYVKCTEHKLETPLARSPRATLAKAH